MNHQLYNLSRLLRDTPKPIALEAIQDYVAWRGLGPRNLFPEEEETTMENGSNVHLVHTTAEGDQYYIAQMEDDHLLNMVRLCCRKMKEATARLNAGHLSKVKQALYGISSKKQEEKAGVALQRITAQIMPYVYECAVRNLDISAMLQDAAGREGRDIDLPTPTGSSLGLLPAPEDRLDDHWKPGDSDDDSGTVVLEAEPVED